METIVTCPCGAKLRLPEQATDRAFTCPKCKATLSAGANGSAAAAPASGQGSKCPICQTSIGPGEAAIACPSCKQVHHQECWTEVGGCATYGCAKAPAAEKEEVAQQPLSAWGDNKKCPVCGETIKAIALKCRYCQAEFKTVDPLTLTDLKRVDRKLGALKTKQNTVIALFVITLLVGCTAPLMCIVNPIWVYKNRADLKAAGPVYLILGYSATALAVVYSLLALLVWLFQ